MPPKPRPTAAEASSSRRTTRNQKPDDLQPSVEEEAEESRSDDNEEPEEDESDNDPNPENMPGPEAVMTPAEELAALRQLVTQLQAQMNQRQNSNDPNQNQRESTVESAFGGTDFHPSGMAAWPVFRPVSDPIEDRNPRYKDKAKSRGEHPGKFEGDKTLFDNWLRKLADKLEEDVTTFRSEKSRMRYVMSQISGDAEKSIETRYQSILRPFSGVAEMVQALETAYHDPNQSSIARRALEDHRFKPDAKADIHQFISQFNSLAQKAKIAESEWSQILWEHLDVNLGGEIFEASTDPNLSYEKFCDKVAKAAYNNQYAFERRAKNNSGKTNTTRNPRKTPNPKTTTAATSGGNKKLTDEQKKVHWDNDTCFGCGKKGHRVAECPESKQVATMDTKPLTEDESSTPNESENE